MLPLGVGVDHEAAAAVATGWSSTTTTLLSTATARGGFLADLRRNLAASSDEGLDYSVLSVALLTLGLILLVEICRHKIDKRVRGRPFAETVLESVYGELSTLGIVEFAIFLGHSYAPNFNTDVEAVFAKVHFLLFFTAIINALMSVLLAFFASRVSYRMWVRTEELELNHYLAIREEFYRVEKLMGEYESSAEEQNAEHGYRLSLRSLQRGWLRFRQTARYPMLRRKYDKLLVQVRFHELRVHFLKANGLPLKFKVSDYLVKSQLYVFKKCVHISTLAWIMVAAAVNLCYFFMGMVAYKSKSQKIVGTTMSWIFIGACIAFIPISYAIFNKMKWIFAQIMSMKLIDYTGKNEADVDSNDSIDADSLDEPEDDAETPSLAPSAAPSRADTRASYSLNIYAAKRSNSSQQRKVLNQLDLFWGGDPHLIIGAFQFMQLGYAIAASILLIFWDAINVYYATVPGIAFILAMLLCYCIFLWIMSQVVPRYTLCTSLGQLVNRRRLHETQAKYKLEEARRKRRHQREEEEFAAAMEKEAKEKARKARKFVAPTAQELQKRSQDENEEVMFGAEAQSSATLIMAKPAPLTVDRRSESSQETEKMAKFFELVQTDSADLPASSQTLADIRKQKRKKRMKSVSDGVAFMRKVTESSTASDAAAAVLAEEGDKKAAPPVPVSEVIPATARSAAASRRRARGSRLQKSVSANVALMRSPTASLFAPAPSLSRASEEKEEERIRPDKPKRRSSLDAGMPTLIEGIPSRSINASDTMVPLGRMSGMIGSQRISSSHRKDAARTSTLMAISETDKDAHNTASSSDARRPERSSDHAMAERLQGGHHTIEEEEDGGEDDDEEVSNKNDDDTIDTAESEGGHSDLEDIPDVSVKSNKIEQQETRSFKMDVMLRRFLQSRKYRLISGVFGTMVVFFIIGMRVEVFLIESGTIKDTENTWHFESISASFWWEVSWLSIFIAVSLLSCFIFSHDCGVNDDLHLVVAGISDIILTAICLSLLLWAETKRCCQTDAECCTKFGSRTYGGLGTIEPFTSLIALRVFRYQFGRFVRKMFRRNTNLSDNSSAEYTKSMKMRRRDRANEFNFRASVASSGLNMTQRSLHDDEEDRLHQKARKTFQHETGTIVDLWKTAIGLYPELVEKYGEFSGELLQAMLGIEIIAEKPRQSDFSETIDSPSSIIYTGEMSPTTFGQEGNHDMETAGTFPAPPKADTIPSTPSNQREGEGVPSLPLTLSKRYSGLAPEAQEVILAGKIGKPVKRRIRSSDASMDRSNFFAAQRDPISPGGESDGVRHRPSKIDTEEFVLDKAQNNEEHNNDDEPSLMFVEPNARLIRSMRRCERRLPPMLNEWAVVDVVLTKHELVYFDATHVDDTGILPDDLAASQEDEAATALRKKRQTVRDAIVAMKGGKGLRLRDVAVGRKVVGHLELSDISSLKVERLPPLPQKDGEADDSAPGDADNGEEEVNQDEYWKGSAHSNTRRPRKYRFKHAMEDRLKLSSTQGSLYLRFFSDLDEWESTDHKEDDVGDGEINKNDTLLWCQTIARLCGTDQLHQKLPNFGEEGSAELLDYIEFVSRELDETDDVKATKKLHRRIRSRVNLAQLGDMMKTHTNLPEPGHVRANTAPSLDVSSGGAQETALEGKRTLRRKASVTFKLDGDDEKKKKDDDVIGLPV